MIVHRSLLILLCLLCVPAFADEQPNIADALDSADAALDKDAQQHTAAPAGPSEVALSDAPTKETYLAATRAYYEYRLSGYHHRARLFEWQLWSSRVIFFIVVLLVFAGIYFAAVQFHVALHAARNPPSTSEPTSKSEETPVRDDAMSLATKLEISTKGVVVNSSILGVVILVLSLAFFYLYLVYVYPIKDVL